MRDVPAQEARPPSGVTIDETRIVALLAVPPSRCVSFETQGVMVILDQTEIVRQAAFSLDRDWKTEAERMAFINARRAQELLKSLGDEKDGAGCRPLKLEGSSESLYLIGNALEAGHAYIAAPSAERRVESIRVRYLGFRSGPTFGRGEIIFTLPQAAQPFLVVSWWVS
jgi:hypothetical protein